MTKSKDNFKTIKITSAIIDKLKEATKISMEFEELTGKQMNITSIVGEILTSYKLDLKLVVDDINESFDAIDKNDKTVQIKTRRYKGVESAMTGPLLNKDYEVPFDYAILTLLNADYSFKEHFIIEAAAIKKHFDRINENRLEKGKAKRKTMSISQFRTIANNT
jgi:hypothetical protein